MNRYYYPAADGGDYGITIVGNLPEKNDFIVMNVTKGKVRYDEPPRRLDIHKASYRYQMNKPLLTKPGTKKAGIDAPVFT